MDFKEVLEFLARHKGKIIGVLLGLIFGWMAITYGFFKTIFVALCVVLGYFAGKRLDEQVDFRAIIAKLFRKD